jgi:DNA modification methylase
MERTPLAVEWVPLGRLFCSPSNPRLNEPAVPHVAASLRRFSWQQPIVAKPSGEVIAGNTRLKAAQSLGMTEVPVVWFQGSDIEATAFSIADNRTHEFSEWINPDLATILEQLRAEDALEGVGFSGADIDALVAELERLTDKPVDDPGPESPPVNPVSRIGDLWILGDQRLLCGDSTRPDDVARLMDGKQAVLFSTDSPYCVEYTGDNRPVHDGKRSGKDWTHVYREIDIADYGVFLRGFLDACLPHLIPEAPLYLWHAHIQQHVIARTFDELDILFHQVIVWVKPTGVFGHSYYRWRHEPCAFGWRRGHKPQHGTGQLDTVWEVDWEGKQRIVGNEHPTQKPLRLFEIPIELHTKPGDVILEAFSGSGSQLVAAAKLGRRCRAMEISPAFVDVGIKRLQQATGKTATLQATGKTFAEVAAERLGAAAVPTTDGS